MRFRPTKLAVPVLASVLLVQPATVQQAPPNRSGTDWPMFRHDEAGTGYSPLAQITPGNVGKLTQAWTYRLQNDAPAPATGSAGARPLSSEATPIVVNGVMYLPAANRVVALEPETGKAIWQHPVSSTNRLISSPRRIRLPNTRRPAGSWLKKKASTTPARSHHGRTARKAVRRKPRWSFRGGLEVRIGAEPRTPRDPDMCSSRPRTSAPSAGWRAGADLSCLSTKRLRNAPPDAASSMSA
jgi:hypothetical protein